MSLNNDIAVTIQDGGVGRLASGKDYYTGLIFQSATVPAGISATDKVARVYSLAQAESLGVTVALYPEAHYHISEYFRVLNKLNVSAFLDIAFYNITTDAFDGTEIQTLQDFRNGELRQIGVYLVDTMADAFVTGADTYAATLDTNGYPVSVFLAADITDYTAVSDLRALDKKWVSVCIAQDGAGTGSALFTSQGYSITAIGAQLGATAAAKVHESIGWVDKFDVSGVTELDTLALADGTLVAALTDAEIDSLHDDGYSILVKRWISGSYFYTDSPTASASTSDYVTQRLNRTVSKAKRLIQQYLAPAQGMPLYVNPTTGYMTETTIAQLNSYVEDALRNLAVAREISVIPETGRIPDNSVTIDPTQDILTNDKVEISAKIVPVGVANDIDVSLSLSTSI